MFFFGVFHSVLNIRGRERREIKTVYLHLEEVSHKCSHFLFLPQMSVAVLGVLIMLLIEIFWTDVPTTFISRH